MVLCGGGEPADCPYEKQLVVRLGCLSLLVCQEQHMRFSHPAGFFALDLCSAALFELAVVISSGYKPIVTGSDHAPATVSMARVLITGCQHNAA